MAVDSLREHLIDELTDLLDAENQLTKALPKMARGATSKPLRTAFERHLKETQNHVTRLEKALGALDERPRRKTCEAMKGLLEEGEELMNDAAEGALRDAMMITAAQKVEHYEMASYGTVRTYAQLVGETTVARLLEQTLKEEKAADVKLTTIAEGSVNQQAASEWQSQSAQGEDNEGMVERSTAWLGAASQQLAGSARRAAASVGLANDRPSAGTRTSARRSRKSSGSTSRTSSGSRSRKSR